MNVNGARFQLLLGRNDWGRCTDGDDGSALALQSLWDTTSNPTSVHPARLPAWDALRNELTLRPRVLELPATAGEAALTLDARRSAAADRYGNVYRVGDDRTSLRVTSAGSGGDADFWPALPADCTPDRAQERLDFAPTAPAARATDERYLALAVTADDYLVVAFARGTVRGFLSFDLVAGGSPVETLWPMAITFEPFDMCARTGGGVWVLDRAHHRLWEFDCKLAVVLTGQPTAIIDATEPDEFQPVSGPLRLHAAELFPEGIALAASPAVVIDPIAIDSSGEGTVFLLDRDAATSLSRVVRMRRTGASWRIDASAWLDRLPALAHDFVYAAAPRYRADSGDKQLFVATTVGNQAHPFVVTDTDSAFELRSAFELYPLRRYAGRALLAVRGKATYDSGFALPAWTGVVQQPRPSFEPFAELVTPVFDSGDIGTTWDKLLFDACLPADTALEIASRAGDEQTNFDSLSSPARSAQVIGTWSSEPSPRLRSTGAEVPWLRSEAARPTKRESGTGTWELLLQNARGRYLQLRIRLYSHAGISSPRLRAMRVWSPRFSYTQRFLPAVYREDPANGVFLERWLANFESTLTLIEDGVVTIQSLFDARTVPNEALGWLAQWFDIALDPGWDERRHRLFVQRAMDFFRWRGTVHGLRLALELAFDPCFDPKMFDGPSASDNGARRIRIIEAYQRRVVGALAAGDPASAANEGPRVVALQDHWTPEEGNAGLAERYARWRGRKVTALEQIAPFSLVAPSISADATAWSAFLQSALGFVPQAGAAERARWQRFLSRHYEKIEELNAEHGRAYRDFNNVPLPQDAETNTTAADDWKTFVERASGDRTRGLWQDFLARRYRRIERLRREHRASWTAFDLVALPDVLPSSKAAQTDWLQFERQLLPMHSTAHRFSVLLPVDSVTADPSQFESRLGLARRLVDLEKPAHTLFDVRYFWAFNRIGEARLEFDTQLGAGSRAPELIPDAVIGRAYIGASFVGGPSRPRDGDRLLIDC